MLAGAYPGGRPPGGRGVINFGPRHPEEKLKKVVQTSLWTSLFCDIFS